ncbi:hypothetical protein TWF730_011163 [Orbilia blumenaviensis]|uniref:F-box domain-containing protein n=1 Tax=Orbilia blumenaviensis TaxID=1796055 RepID=A0AAV9UL26_9PEZI
MIPNKGLFALPAELHIEILGHLPLADLLRASQASVFWSKIILDDQALKRTRYASIAPGIKGFHQLVSQPGALMCRIVEGVVQEYLYMCDERRPPGEDDLVFEGEKQLRYRQRPRFDISKHWVLDEPILSSIAFPNTFARTESKFEREPHYGLERDYYGCRETVQSPRPWAPVDGITVREFVQTIAVIAHVNSPDWAFLKPSRLDGSVELLFWHGWDGEDEGSLEPVLDGIFYH